MKLQKTKNEITTTLNFLHNVDEELESLDDDIYLMNCYVMYIYDYDLYYYPTEESIELEATSNNKNLKIGDLVEVRNEPCKDRDTVIALYCHGKKIGFVFKAYDEALTNLMKAGMEIYGKVESIITNEVDAVEIYCDLFLKD